MEVDSTAAGNNEALEGALLESARLAKGGDVVGNGKVQIQLVTMCYEGGELEQLQTIVTTLTKKRSLIKQAVAEMVQKCVEFISQSTSPSNKQFLINMVRTVTEGKIYVEVERARVTRMLAQMRESEGKIKEAAELMQELQVETFGSMERRERIEFILEQMRLSLQVQQFQQARIISRKITNKTFEAIELEDLKLRYLELMVSLAVHDRRYLECSRFYQRMTEIGAVQRDQARLLAVLKLAAIFVVLACHDHEQAEQLYGIFRDKRLEQAAIYRELLRTFLTKEIVRWPMVEQAFGSELHQSFPALFGAGRKEERGSRSEQKTESKQSPSQAEQEKECEERWNQLRERVTEHNVRTIAGFYTRISLQRFAALLEIADLCEAEQVLCRLVTTHMVNAKIDRLSGQISFVSAPSPDLLLNSWNTRVDSLLSLMVKTNHQVAKEEMLHSVLSSN